MIADRNYIDATMTLTYGQTHNEINNRERVEKVGIKGLEHMLEQESKGQPLIIIVANVLEGNVSRGDKRYRMREAKHIIVYERKSSLEQEQERQIKEAREQKREENQVRMM